MSGLLPIVVVVILFLVIRSIAQKAAPSSNPSGKGGTLGDILQQAIHSASNEKWMAAAGALKSRYQRPAPGKSPSIEGESNGLKFSLFLAHPNAANVSCRIQFPESLNKDLQIVYTRYGELSKFFRKSPMIQDSGFSAPHLGGTCADLRWYKKYLAENDRVDVIDSMTNYLLSFQITDTGINAVFDNNQNFPDVPMVEVLLLDAAVLFAVPEAGIALADEPEESVPPIRMKEDKPVKSKTEPVPPMPEVQPIKPVPVSPMPQVTKPEVANKSPMPEVAKPKPVFSAAPAAVPAPVVSPVKMPEAATVPELSLEQQEFCNTLFRKSIPGKAENDAFAAVKGKAVEWKGTVLSSYDFTFDFAFGNRKGVKATLLLCEITGNGSLKQKVKVHVAFPAELSAELKQKRNEQIAFRGTLLKMEAFSREIYIENGELI